MNRDPLIGNGEGITVPGDSMCDEDVEEFDLDTIKNGWPADSAVQDDEPIEPTPIRTGANLEQCIESDSSYTVVTEGTATCFHCGVKLGEYSSMGTKVLTHGDGYQFYSMVVKPEDVQVNPAYLAAKIGKWIREIHKADIINELYGGPALPEPKRIIVTAPPAPAYTETHPNKHVADVFNELVGENVRSLAAALHIVEILGPMEQWTILITDTCGFKGQIILRVTEMGDHTDEREEDNTTGESGRRDGGDVHAEEREEYRHDPSDPAHDEGPFSI